MLGELGLSIEQFDDGCSAGNVPAETAHRVIVRYATAFFQRYVAGDDRYRPLVADEGGLGPDDWLESR